VSNPFRKMRAITDKTLHGALTDHRDVIARLVQSSLAQNRWNVGMVGMIVLSYVWLALVTYTPSYAYLGPRLVVGAVALVWLLRRLNRLRGR
jgi:hypothetical protein